MDREDIVTISIHVNYKIGGLIERLRNKERMTRSGFARELMIIGLKQYLKGKVYVAHSK